MRGQKSRFQLFGDTMNTASRIESTGRKGRIHVSQACADQLIAKGRSSWLVPREDVVTAKGKGAMQTYWVTPRETASSVAVSSVAAPNHMAQAQNYKSALDEGDGDIFETASSSSSSSGRQVMVDQTGDVTDVTGARFDN